MTDLPAGTNPCGLPWLDAGGRFSLLKALTFAALFVPAIWMTTQWASGAWEYPSPYVWLIYNSGLWATLLLLGSLAVTPARRIFRLNRLVAVRRMIGVGALAYSLFHLFTYLGLRSWDASVIIAEWSSRISLWVATVALVGLIPLGLTSFDRAVRWMGGVRWKQLHRAVYWLAGLAVLHFLMSPGSNFGMPFVMFGAYLWLMAWRLLERRRLGTRPAILFALGVGTALLTFLFEPIWLSTFLSQYGAYPFFDTLAVNFDLEWWSAVGVPATVVVLFWGMVVAVAAALSGRLRPAPGALRRAG